MKFVNLLSLRMKAVVDAVMCCPNPHSRTEVLIPQLLKALVADSSQLRAFPGLALGWRKLLCPRSSTTTPNLHPMTGWWAGTEVESTSLHLGQPEGPSRAQSPCRINWGRPLCDCITVQSLPLSNLLSVQPHRCHSREHSYTQISESQGAQPATSRFIWSYMSLLIATFILSKQTLQ